jgi:RNA polymerase sigma-70 factor (ECF subfamily)
VAALVHQRPQPLDDATLVRRVRAGDDRALSQFYLRHARTVAGVIYRVLGSDVDLDDIVYEVFVEASESLANPPHRASLRRWLLSLAVRKAELRLKKRRGWLFFSRRADARADSRQGRVVRPPSEAVRAKYDRLERLSPKLRIAWVLHAFEGESVAEIAAICDASPAKVRRRIARAATRLQKLER